MIKRDMCDFMFTFMGKYSLDEGETKYIRFFPERMTSYVWNVQQHLRDFRNVDGVDEDYINEELKKDHREEDQIYVDINERGMPRASVPVYRVVNGKQEQVNPNIRLYPNGIPLNTRFLLHDLDAIVDRLALICM
jgi:hypothetical protein